MGLLDGLPLALEMAGARAAALSTSDLADEARAPARRPRARRPGRRRAALPRSGPRGLVADLLDPAQRRALDGWPVFASPCRPATRPQSSRSRAGRVESLAAPARCSSATARPAGPAGCCAPSAPSWASRRTTTPCVPGTRRPSRRRAHDLRRDLRGPRGGRRTASRLDGLLAEARAAHAWARRSDLPSAVRITRALHDHAVDGLHDEVLGWAAQNVADLGPPTQPRTSLASRLVLGGRHVEGAGHARRALATADDPVDRMHALEALADAALFEGEHRRRRGDRRHARRARDADGCLVGVGHEVPGAAARVHRPHRGGP